MRNISFVLESTFSHIENFMQFIANQIMIADSNKPEIIDGILSNARENMDETKQRIFTYKNFDFTNPEGYVIVNSKGINPNPPKLDDKIRKWFKTAKKTPWKGQLSNIATGVNSNQPIIPFGFGVTNKDNKLLGIISIGVSIEKLKERINENLEGQDYYKYIILDNNLNYIMSSEGEELKEHDIDYIKEELSYLKDLKNNGLLKEGLNIRGTEYIFYSKTKEYPFVVLAGVEKRDIFNSKDLEVKILQLNKESRYKEMFLLSLLYLFQHKIVNPIIDKKSRSNEEGFKIPKEFNASVNDFFLELEQMENFTDMKIDREVDKKVLTEKQHLMAQRETFFKSLVHDLRNPLGQVECALGLLQAEGKVEGEEYQMMQVGIDNIRNLVDGVLLIAKLESGNLELNKTNIDLSSFVDDIIKANKFTYALEGIDLTKEMIGNKYISVLADEQILERCIANLLSNARKFTKKGCVKIIISKDEKNKEVIINVKDTGEGIKKEDIPKILEEFGQTEEGKKKKSSTGIGLPTVKKFIELHGGRLEIESEVEKGSEFRLVLPV